LSPAFNRLLSKATGTQIPEDFDTLKTMGNVMKASPQLAPADEIAATLIDPAFQAAAVMHNPRATAQASQDRWGPALDGNLAKLGSDYWNNPGTALAQDLYGLQNNSNPFKAAAGIAVTVATNGVVNPYTLALGGNLAGGFAHMTYHFDRRYMPVMAAGAATALGINPRVSVSPTRSETPRPTTHAISAAPCKKTATPLPPAQPSSWAAKGSSPMRAEAAPSPAKNRP
jgi:hypothetical protein